MKKIFTSVLFINFYFLSIAQKPGSLGDPFGVKNFDFGFNNSQAKAIAITKDGKVVTAGGGGYGNVGALIITRTNPDGSADPTLQDIEVQNNQYYNTGKIGYRIYYEFGNAGDALAIQPDNKMVIAGTHGDKTYVGRFKENGDFDSSFGTNGKQILMLGAISNDIKILNNGNIILAGMYSIMRLLPNGTPDSSFGKNASFNTSFYINKIVIQTDGKIVATGDKSIARFTSDGSPDPTFQQGSVGSVNGSAPSLTQFYALALQSDGKIVVAARTSDNAFAVLRYNPDGSIDNSFHPTSGTGGNGIVEFNFQNGSSTPKGIAMQTDGKIVIGGEAQLGGNFAYSGYVVARLTSSGDLDSSFGSFSAPATMLEPGRSYYGSNLHAYNIVLGQNRIYIAGTSQDRYESGTVIVGFYNNGTPMIINGPAACNPIAISINEQYFDQFTPVTLTANPSSGQGPFRYMWSTGETTQIIQDIPSIPNPLHIEAETGSAPGIKNEPTTDIGGGLDVGYIEPGVSLLYFLNLPTTGLYTVSFRIASPASNASFDLTDADLGTVYASIKIPNTGGYQNWVTVTAQIQLRAGRLGLFIHNTSPVNNHWNINWIEFLRPAKAPMQHIEAENYVSMQGVVTEPTSDTGGGKDVGYIDPGDFMNYILKVPATGLYTINFRVASAGNNSTFDILKSDGTYVTTVHVPNTGGFQKWTTVSASIPLTSGTQTIRILSTAAQYNNWNLNWLEIVGAPKPGYWHIEGENYSSMKGVVNEPTTDAGGGLDVGYIDPSDWMNYRVNIPLTGTYRFNFRVACPGNNCSFDVRDSVDNTLASVKVPNTGGFQNWTMVSQSIQLPVGMQTLKLVSTSPMYNDWNLNWFDIIGDPYTLKELYSVIVTDANGCQGYASINILDIFQGQVPAYYYQDQTQKRKDRALVETELPLDIMAYPNPSASSFNLQVTLADQGNSSKLIIYNQLGNIVEQFDLGKTKNLTVGNNYSNGIYMAKLVQGKNQKVIRLVKIH